KISCIEEIAYLKGFIDKIQLLILADQMRNSTYGQYLFNIVEERRLDSHIYRMDGNQENRH
ncbi:MAG: hypothetical protein KAR16_07365, partial [Bacteroidales bacterium]|nr:hypothetical protein [Bacteroidales bacterium]